MPEFINIIGKQQHGNPHKYTLDGHTLKVLKEVVSNPKFESYAPKFFDFTVVRKRMTEMTKDELASSGHTRINTKKFIQVLYFEAKRLMEIE